jgi:hypothetical protein
MSTACSARMLAAREAARAGMPLAHGAAAVPTRARGHAPSQSQQHSNSHTPARCPCAASVLLIMYAAPPYAAPSARPATSCRVWPGGRARGGGGDHSRVGTSPAPMPRIDTRMQPCSRVAGQCCIHCQWPSAPTHAGCAARLDVAHDAAHSTRGAEAHVCVRAPSWRHRVQDGGCSDVQGNGRNTRAVPSPRNTGRSNNRVTCVT